MQLCKKNGIIAHLTIHGIKFKACDFKRHTQGETGSSWLGQVYSLLCEELTSGWTQSDRSLIQLEAGHQWHSLGLSIGASFVFNTFQ